jgi:adenylate cyclase
MESERVARRLAAIVAADMAGYSRLMSVDEAGTLARLKALRSELIDLKIAQYDGRVVKTTGDGLLLEFPSVVDAVQCAVEVQRGIAARNADVPDERRIAFRMGVNLGDVIIEGDDIFGDGINLAARLEGVAEPGSVCLSAKVHDEVRNKLPLDFDDLGERELKNIDGLVRVYQVRTADPAQAARQSGVAPAAEQAVDVSAPVAGFGGRPAIAVLPFENMSGDEEQEFFADGIAEDILTRLAAWRWLPVIARSSSFAYKGAAVDVKRVGPELGARYVLEGSVRKAGSRVRVTAQLIDAESDHHVWAERYDRELDDIFALQDEITDSIVAALEPAVGKAETQRAHARDPRRLDAWTALQRGTWNLFRYTREDFDVAAELYRTAIEMDPNLAMAHVHLGWLHFVRLTLSWSDQPARTLAEAYQAAQAALALDDDAPGAHAVAGFSKLYMRDYDGALEELARAVELAPSTAMHHYVFGVGLLLAGRPAEAIPEIEQAIRLIPNDSLLVLWISSMSWCHYMLRRYDEALDWAQKAVRRGPHYPMGQRCLTQALAMLGRVEEAKAPLAEFLRLVPDYSYEGTKMQMPFKDPEDFEHYFAGIRKAGWDG